VGDTFAGAAACACAGTTRIAYLPRQSPLTAVRHGAAPRGCRLFALSAPRVSCGRADAARSTGRPRLTPHAASPHRRPVRRLRLRSGSLVYLEHEASGAVWLAWQIGKRFNSSRRNANIGGDRIARRITRAAHPASPASRALVQRHQHICPVERPACCAGPPSNTPRPVPRACALQLQSEAAQNGRVERDLCAHPDSPPPAEMSKSPDRVVPSVCPLPVARSHPVAR